jgi:hypothetical protein
MGGGGCCTTLKKRESSIGFGLPIVIGFSVGRGTWFLMNFIFIYREKLSVKYPSISFFQILLLQYYFRQLSLY